MRKRLSRAIAIAIAIGTALALHSIVDAQRGGGPAPVRFPSQVQFEASAEQYRRLARKSINQADLRKYVRRALRIEDEQDISTRSKNLIEEIVRLAESGRGNDLPSIRGTYWAAYDGLSEWLTHLRGRSADNRLNSLWFGDGAITNRHALAVALDMAV